MTHLLLSVSSFRHFSASGTGVLLHREKQVSGGWGWGRENRERLLMRTGLPFGVAETLSIASTLSN